MLMKYVIWFNVVFGLVGFWIVFFWYKFFDSSEMWFL